MKTILKVFTAVLLFSTGAQAGQAQRPSERAKADLADTKATARVAEAKQLLQERVKAEVRIKEIDARLAALDAGAEPNSCWVITVPPSCCSAAAPIFQWMITTPTYNYCGCGTPYTSCCTSGTITLGSTPIIMLN